MKIFDRIPQCLAVLGATTALIGLAGCSILGGGGVAYPARYTLDAGPADTAARATTSSTGYTLDLRPVGAPGWLDSNRMLYRLDSGDTPQISAYTQSAWADTPARLVGDNLKDTLSGSGLFAAVLGEAPGQADLALQLELSDFSQRFASSTVSHGHIAATATLLAADSGAVIAQKRFETMAGAPTADAAGGVDALAAADARLNREIRQWLATTLAQCGKACPEAGTE